MFERYTESARRVIFDARYFASELGCQFIEPEHILLGVLEEEPELFHNFLKSTGEFDQFRSEIEGRARGPVRGAAYGDMALSAAGKRVLAYAAEESDRLNNREIRPAHLVNGLLREHDSAAACALRKCGLELPHARMVFVAAPEASAAPHARAEDLHRLVDELPASQLGRARALLLALREADRQSGGV